MKLAIGTAQFGLHYGIGNKIGKTPVEGIKKIINIAENNNINVLDTSPAYGNSEEVLGSLNLNLKWGIVTKTSEFKDINYVLDQFKNSMCLLKRNSIYALLIHNIEDIYKKKFQELYSRLIEFKEKGFIKKLGFSIYKPEHIDYILEKYKFDIIQVPINIFDQRLIDGGYLKLLKEHQVEIHARSIFLQGILLYQGIEHVYFKKWSNHFNSYFTYLKENKISCLASAISFVNQIAEIDRLIVGVNNAKQFKEITSAIKENIDMNYQQFKLHDVELINPSLWKV